MAILYKHLFTGSMKFLMLLFLIGCSIATWAQPDIAQATKPAPNTTSVNDTMVAAKQPANWQQYLGEALKIPKNFWDEKVVVKIYVAFSVTPDGSIDSVKIFSSQGHINKKRATADQLTQFADIAIKAVSGSPKWTPAIRNGLPIRSYFTLPFSFNMN